MTQALAPTVHPFMPELMMRRTELTKARRLLRKLDRIHAQSRIDGELPKPKQKGCQHFTKLSESVWSAMDTLAEEVWKREAGLERYSVIHVVRDDMEFRLQVLRFSFFDHFRMPGLWAWDLDGRALRKDDTLGLKDARAVFNFAQLQRRHLDGVWRELRWLNEETA
jgi:hypothetical protein